MTSKSVKLVFIITIFLPLTTYSEPTPPSPYHQNPPPEPPPADYSDCNAVTVGCVDPLDFDTQGAFYCASNWELFVPDEDDTDGCRPENETGLCVECDCPSGQLRNEHVCIPDMQCDYGIQNPVTGLCWPDLCPYGDGTTENCFPAQQCADGEDAELVGPGPEYTECACPAGKVWSDFEARCITCPVEYLGYPIDEACRVPMCVNNIDWLSRGYPSNMTLQQLTDVCENMGYPDSLDDAYPREHALLFEGGISSYPESRHPDDFVCLNSQFLSAHLTAWQSEPGIGSLAPFVDSYCPPSSSSSSSSSSSTSSSTSSSSSSGGAFGGAGQPDGGGNPPSGGEGAGPGPAGEQPQSGDCDPTSSGYLDCIGVDDYMTLPTGDFPANTEGHADFSDVFSEFTSRRDGSPIFQALDNVGGFISFETSECPELTIDLTETIIGTEITADFHCWLMTQIAGYFSVIMIAIYTLMGFKIVASA